MSPPAVKLLPFTLFLLLGLAPLRGSTIFWEELPYFSAADSPFYEGIRAGTIYLEDFEDHELNTPNIVSWDWPRVVGTVNGRDVISEQIGRPTSPGNPNTTWSVDADDGLNGDFRGHNGDTWTTGNRFNGQTLGRMEFRFTPDILGRYPTFVGFVITEADNPFRDVEFGTSTLTGPESPEIGYDPLTWIPRLDSFPGDTRTHRFFGIYDSSGIWRLNIDNVRQIDHLQYGYAIPEPGTAALLAFGALFPLSWRRRAS